MTFVISAIVVVVVSAAIALFARSRKPKAQPPLTSGGGDPGRKTDQV